MLYHVHLTLLPVGATSVADIGRARDQLQLDQYVSSDAWRINVDGRIEGVGVDREESKKVIERFKSDGWAVSIQAEPFTRLPDLEKAQYVPLACEGEYVDLDDDWNNLNQYSWTNYSQFIYPDLDRVPNPYRIRGDLLRKRQQIYPAANGILIIERQLDALFPELWEWCDHGDVEVCNTARASAELIWMRPSRTIGPYRNSVVHKSVAPEYPLEVRKKRAEDPFERELLAITRMPTDAYPIARVGNWFGEIIPYASINVSWDVVISGKIHQRLRQANIRGFVPATAPIVERDRAVQND
ncbi:hypothetical protein HED60_19550 [Planctomycetales bacterium ZRK34]|nr:hypothetical protein HED60_19550 [Planctomycetales bacterium ZRK34]